MHLFTKSCLMQEEVRRHFNCSTLEGAELEDQGINGTVLTHWEKRVFEVRFVLGADQCKMTLSSIGLSLLGCLPSEHSLNSKYLFV
jgi:hypothetical protein